MVTINGKSVSFSVPTTIGEYLDNHHYHRQHIAIERNGKILTKSDYDTTFFADGDKIEIVNFVGGG